MAETVGIIGCGVMGRGIAQCFLLAGYEVLLSDLTAELSENGRKTILAALKKRKGEAAAQELSSRLKSVRDDQGLSGCSVIVEACLEELEVKREVFQKLEKCVPRDCLLLSNTSSLSLSAIAEGLVFPERTAGMHFFNPADRMELVELVRGERTSEETVGRLYEIADRLGKTAVLSLDTPGFIVNRVLAPMLNEAILLYESGSASKEDIDRGLQLGANHPMGPLALCDLVGLDVLLHVMEQFSLTLDPVKYAPAPLLRRMVAEGKLGVKTGEGFYSYPR